VLEEEAVAPGVGVEDSDGAGRVGRDDSTHLPSIVTTIRL